MTYPLVQFVSAPEVDADVRFDFNAVGSWADAETWPGHEGFSIGVPSLEGDPDAVGVEYGFRELSFSLFIKGDKASALAAQSALAKEILRRTNWLRFQLTEHSEPVWFKTYRTAPGELDFQYVYTETAVDHWGIAVTLTADPFAYGARETLPTVTINNDPAAATNPMSYVLPEIKGDAPAPLRFDVTRIGGGGSGQRVMLSVAQAPAWSAPIVVNIGTGDGATAGTDVGAPVADVAYSGGSYRSISFSTDATMVNRLTFNTPTIPVGIYKVLVRMARSDTSSTFGLRFFSDLDAGAIVSFDRSATSSGGYAQWVDLGSFSFPTGMNLNSVTDGVASTAVTFQSSRLSGTGSANIDAFLFVPIRVAGAEAATTLLSDVNVTVSGNPYLMRWDGDDESFQFIDNGNPAPLFPTANMGAFPLVKPGVTNVLHLVQKAGAVPARYAATVNNGDDITYPTDLAMSYRPRFLYLGAA